MLPQPRLVGELLRSPEGDPPVALIFGGPVIGLDALDGHWQTYADLVDECDRRLDRVVVIDFQHPIAGGLIDGRELVEAAGPDR